jgi:hypothetical protein
MPINEETQCDTNIKLALRRALLSVNILKVQPFEKMLTLDPLHSPFLQKGSYPALAAWSSGIVTACSASYGS